MIDKSHELPVVRQIQLLELSRSSVYYQAQPPTEANLKLMRRIDELHLEHPFAGARMLRDMLKLEGHEIGRKHVGTLMKKLDIQAIYRKANTLWQGPTVRSSLNFYRLSGEPKDLYDTRLSNPSYSDGIDRSDWRQVQTNNYIHQFLESVFKRRVRPSLSDDELQFYKNPFHRLFTSKQFAKDRKQFLASQFSDPQQVNELFGVLSEKNAKFGPWVRLAKEWFSTVPQEKRGLSLDTLQRFFVSYLLDHKIVVRPEQFFHLEFAPKLPPISAVFRFSASGDQQRYVQLSAYFDWVLASSRLDPKTHGNPFPVQQTIRRTNKVRISDDKDLGYLTEADPLMEDWRRFAAEWLSLNPTSYGHRIWALSYFFRRYILHLDLDRNPIAFLSSRTANPPFLDVYMATKKVTKKGVSSIATDHDVRINNMLFEFLQWVLEEKLSEEDDYGHRIVPSELKNPIEIHSFGGTTLPETNKNPLPIRYIVELRKMLAEGPTFRDWKWAQSANSGAWFDVSPEIIDEDDPNCVFRVSEDGRVQLWSPARSVALYIKLELPLRTFQVRMLDSGEADTWRYEGGEFIENPSPLATGSPQRPYKKGIFYKSNESSGGDEVGLFINTNKTADIDKPEDKKGYVSQQSAASTIFEDKGICPVAGQYCDVGGPPATSSKVKVRYLPVPGYPKRNCVRCRFFLTGPAFLPGLVAHFNKLSYDVNNASQRYARLDVAVRELENERFLYQNKGLYFPKTGDLERVQQRYEAEAEQLNQLVLDMQYCHKLVTKSVELGQAEETDSKLQLVTNGTITDLGFALKETKSEMHQIEVVCENAIFYPEIDARQAVLRRSHLLDLMFDINGREPIFYKLSEEQQHIAGNAVIKLIKARSGSLESAVEFVEGHRKLAELGLFGDDFDSVLQGVSSKQALKALTYDLEADSSCGSAGEQVDAS